MCGSPCQQQCGKPEVTSCIKSCEQGCFCQAGYIRDDNGKCISEEECSSFLEFTVCQKELYQSMHQSLSGQTGFFIPTCDENGDFSPVQCYGSTGYCWCAQRDGTEIEGTHIRGEPSCTTRMLQPLYK